MSTSSKVLTAILTHLKNSAKQDFYDPKENRRFLEQSARQFKPDPVVGFERFSIDSIPSAWIIPPERSSNDIILYLHGGGFVAGSINTHRDLCSRIAKATHQKVLLIDYRLAPEHPFPAGLDDAVLVYRWLIDHHIPSHRISLVGDSAGGNMVLSLLLKLKSLDIALPAKAVLMSPWLILNTPSRSSDYKPNADRDPMFTYGVLGHTAKMYVTGEIPRDPRFMNLDYPFVTSSGTVHPIADSLPGHGETPCDTLSGNTDPKIETLLADPLVSPLNGDLSGLPPLLIQVGTREILLEDSELLARNAKAAGVDVTLEVWDEMFHVWQYFARYLKEGRQAIDCIAHWFEAPG